MVAVTFGVDRGDARLTALGMSDGNELPVMLSEVLFNNHKSAPQDLHQVCSARQGIDVGEAKPADVVHCKLVCVAMQYPPTSIAE